MIDHYLNDDVTNVKPITDKEYQPCCCTPLYDAIGKCCTRLERQIGDRNDVAVSVTIITDGYENDSKEWTGAAVKKLIERLKEKGWLFAYIGANQDMEQVRFNMSIDNTLEFDASPQGAEKMFKRERAARMKWMKSVSHCDTSEVRDFNAGYFTQSESEPEDDWE
jgi:hypothetical protein